MVDDFDYEKLGLISGLEIHQQLDTKKLFCNCPSILRQEDPDFKIKRKLHVVAGELGDVDVAASYQSSLDKEFVYEGYTDTVCLVETDEEPPHIINEEALKIALQISLLLNAKIIPITQIMRKIVLDGSNTSGFQRTVLIARDGFIETNFGRVGIETICLEEDSARIITKDEKTTTYRLDRLGIPLVEIATKPEIKTPQQAKEVALFIGELLRLCKVKRGIGTIRQDVNLSIKNGGRIELKGFQDVRNIELAIEKEVKRQLELVKKNQSISEVRKVLPDGSSEFLRPMPGPARLYPETDLPLLKISRKLLNEIKKILPRKKNVEKELEERGLNKEMISLLLKENKLEEFKELLQIIKNPKVIVKALILYPKEIATKNKISVKYVEKKLNKDSLSYVLEKLKEGKISENNLKDILEKLVIGADYKELFKIHKETKNIEEKIMQLLKEKPGLSKNAYMGLIMQEFKGKISGKEVSEIINKYMK